MRSPGPNRAAVETSGAPGLRLALALVTWLLAGTAAAQPAAAPPATSQAAPSQAWPTRGWQSAEPESVGLDAAALTAFHAELESGAHGYVDGMLVVRHGRIAFEKRYSHDYDAPFEGRGAPGIYNYYDPEWHPWYRHGTLHTLQSVSKSVTSALVGIALRQGAIPGVEVEAMPWFEGYRVASDPRWKRMTLADLLTMRAGIRWDESSIPYTDPRNSCAAMEASQDWVQFVLDQPMAAEPGELFVYNSGVTVLLAQALFAATGIHADAYAQQRLFGPLGIEAHYWKQTPSGHPDTEGGLYLAARDLAKIGYLFSQDGVWEGQRLLPPGWAQQSTAPLVAVSTTAGRESSYGYQWWATPWGGDDERRWAMTARGYGGQYLFVVPELDLIAVFNGWNIYDQAPLSPHLALERVLAAVKDGARSGREPRPPAPAGRLF